MKRKDLIFHCVNNTEVFDNTGNFIGILEGVSPSDIDKMTDEDFDCVLKYNGIKL